MKTQPINFPLSELGERRGKTADSSIPTPSDASDETGYSANGEYLTVRVGGSSHTKTIREWHELAVCEGILSDLLCARLPELKRGDA